MSDPNDPGAKLHELAVLDDARTAERHGVDPDPARRTNHAVRPRSFDDAVRRTVVDEEPVMSDDAHPR
ncbi:MAG: hypothetical protein JOY78_02670 [Pseudonocardia sp.]|nr:hypothetical protein [Pseudonocardia sp.]